MSKFLEKLKSVSTVTEYGHGAFGESERYQKLDVDKFAQNIINECVLAIKNLPTTSNTEDKIIVEVVKALRKKFED